MQGGSFQMQINAVGVTGFPTNTMLASTGIPDAWVPFGEPVTITGVFGAPAMVTAGQEYALVITRPGGTSWGNNGHDNGTCPGGWFHSTLQTGAQALEAAGLRE